MPLAAPWSTSTVEDWQALAREYGTPYYLFDADFVASRIAAVHQAFGGMAGVYYAVKANPNLALLRAVQPVADGVDISSGGEQQQALLAGYAPEAMSFAGPAKSEAEIESAVAAGVGCISAESLREIDACAAASKRLDKVARILLRVNPTAVHRAYGLKMGGKASQFGIDETELPAAEGRVRSHGALIDCRGIHSYVGSQCFDLVGAVDATRNALRIAAESSARLGTACRKVNLGGGFGIAQAGESRQLDLAALGELLKPVLTEFRAAHSQAQVFFELGRYITAEAGIYVTSVVDVKHSRGTQYAACNGGLSHHLNAAGTFGALLRGNFPLVNLSRPDVPTEEFAVCNVAGPSCNPTDLLGVQVMIAPPRVGDLLGVLMSGAYGLTASPILFLGRDTPPELVRQRGQVEVGRRRRTMTEFN